MHGKDFTWKGLILPLSLKQDHLSAEDKDDMTSITLKDADRNPTDQHRRSPPKDDAGTPAFHIPRFLGRGLQSMIWIAY